MEKRFNKFVKSLLDVLGNAKINRIPFKAEKLEKIIENIEKKFKETENVRKEFGENFDEFLNEIVWLSYGFSYDNTNGKPVFTNEYEQRKKEVEDLQRTLCLTKDTQKYPELVSCKESLESKLYQQEEYCQRSMRMVDLFVLINYLIEEYPLKYKGYENFKMVTDNLTASFNENFFDNVYDRYKTYSGKKICLFNREKFCVGSYLHSAHPYIHYLDVKDEQNNLLATAILVEASGNKAKEEEGKEYLVVEGVVGKIETPADEEKVFSLLWESIKKFAEQKNKGGIILNISHAGSQIEPEKFLKFVFEKEKPVGDSYTCEVITETINGKETYQFKIATGGKDLDKDQFSYNFQILTLADFSKRVGGLRGYNNEQYLEMFFHREDKKEKFYPFGLIGGKGFGFEIPLKRYMPTPLKIPIRTLDENVDRRQKENRLRHIPKKQKRFGWPEIIVVSILAASGGYGLAKIVNIDYLSTLFDKSEREKQAKEKTIEITGFVGDWFKPGALNVPKELREDKQEKSLK